MSLADHSVVIKSMQFFVSKILLYVAFASANISCIHKWLVWNCQTLSNLFLEIMSNAAETFVIMRTSNDNPELPTVDCKSNDPAASLAATYNSIYADDKAISAWTFTRRFDPMRPNHRTPSCNILAGLLLTGPAVIGKCVHIPSLMELLICMNKSRFVL